jgi:hypothetical protein
MATTATVPSTAATPGAPTAVSAPAGSDLTSTDLDDDDKTLLGPPVNWPPDTVKTLHKIVFEETQRTMVTPQFLPHSVVPPKTRTVPLNLITPLQLDASSSGVPAISNLTIDEGQYIRVHELWTELALTDQQVIEVGEATNPDSTSMAVATRIAAQYHALAQDMVAFQGAMIYPPTTNDPFFSQYVGFRQGQNPVDGGLVGFQLNPSATSPNPPYTVYNPNQSNPYVYADFYTTSPASPGTVQVVQPMTPPLAGVIWGDGALTACAAVVANLTNAGNPGPFAAIFHTVPYADLFAPAGPESLAITYDRVAPLFKVGVFTTNALPSTPVSGSTPAYYTAVIVSVGGNAVSLGVGQYARLRHMQRDPQGWHRFRILGRQVLLVSDLRAVGHIIFQGPTP